MEGIAPRTKDILNKRTIRQDIVDGIEFALDEVASTAVNCLDQAWVAKRDDIRSQAHYLSVLFVKLDLDPVDACDVVKAPPVCKLCPEWTGELPQIGVKAITFVTGRR